MFWDVPCSGDTGEVAERAVLSGDRTRVLSDVLALHRAQRGFSSGEDSTDRGSEPGPAPVQSRELQCPHHSPGSWCWSRLALPSRIPELQV